MDIFLPHQFIYIKKNNKKFIELGLKSAKWLIKKHSIKMVVLDVYL